MNKLYTYVNHENLTIDNLAQFLPENWKNILGLNLYSDEKLENLSWAGHSNYGWVNLSTFDLSSYTPLPEWLELSKNGMKSIVSKFRYEAETEPLIWNGHQIKIDERTKTSLSFKILSAQSNLDYKCFWKFSGDDIAELTISELKNISTLIDDHIQKCFELEFQKITEIENCETPYDLGNINLNINLLTTTNQ